VVLGYRKRGLLTFSSERGRFSQTVKSVILILCRRGYGLRPEPLIVEES